MWYYISLIEIFIDNSKYRKERKKLLKKSSPPTHQINVIEERLAKIQLDKSKAETEALSKIKDQKYAKMKKFEDGLKKFSSGQLELCKKGQIIFEAGIEVIGHIPDIRATDEISGINL